ncbi:hypothetical protein C8R45DRAFT_924234 [Mycena sanguinolenta]|nr:hypothetical protein C8R45DRAFT_924234 [Mycena sanguinolenta]
MQLSLKLSMAAVLALAAEFVAAVPASDDALVVSHQAVQASGLILTYWVEAPGVAARAPAPAPRDCMATDEIICSDSHVASSAVCSELLSIVAANPNEVIGATPRAICLGTSDATKCCMSWSQNDAPG